MPLRWSVNAPTARTSLALFALLALVSTRAAAQNPSATATSISGIVYDSLAGKPLAGALVQLVAHDSPAKVLSATSGTDGGFEIADVPPGSYIIGFFHPVLDSLGIGVSPRPLEIADAAPVNVSLGIPSAVTLRNLLCPPSAPADSSGLLIGFVRDADEGVPLAGASVVVMWRELVVDKGIHTGRREIPVKTNSEGWYALCGLPTDGPITARAELGDDASGYIEISVPPHGLLHRDFGIPRDSAAVTVAADVSTGAAAGQTVRRGSARLTGSVRDEKGRPLSGARLLVWGSGVTGSTGEDGTFILSGLPAGTQALEVRYVGYAPRRVTVDLASHATRSVTVTLDQRADVLGQVTVYGKPSKRQRDFTGFFQRSKSGFGHFLTRADIEKRHPFQFTDLFRMIPGFMVIPDSGFGYRIVSSRGTNLSGKCQPTIYINGMRIYDATDIDGLVLPNDIAAVEAYAGPAGAPPQYTADACGSILIWTGPDLGSTQN
jgi:hypothetical protein